MGAFMSEFERLKKKQNQIFILVCINFSFFIVLFAGLGYVTWQSATLINRLKGDLVIAEQTITKLQNRFQQMDTEVIVDRLVTSATKQIGVSVRQVVQDANMNAPIVKASENLATTKESIEQTGKAIQGIHETFKGLDNEEIAQLVSYNILKGLGDGFQEAAENRKPENNQARKTETE
jgi:hypothetical protein